MAFDGVEAFQKGMCKLIVNHPMNNLWEMPKIVGESFLKQGKRRIMSNEGLRKKFLGGIYGPAAPTNMDVAKSMFYNRKGEFSYGRAGAAGVAGLATADIAGSYIFGDK